MAVATDLLLKYMALRDLISSLFLLSRILPYNTAIPIPIRIDLRKGIILLFQVCSHFAVGSLSVTLSLSPSLCRSHSHSLCR
jgi:hypothetical protein